jgi:hypothetical protein
VVEKSPKDEGCEEETQQPGSENWPLSFVFSPYKSFQTSFFPLLKGEGGATAPGEVWER